VSAELSIGKRVRRLPFGYRCDAGESTASEVSFVPARNLKAHQTVRAQFGKRREPQPAAKSRPAFEHVGRPQRREGHRDCRLPSYRRFIKFRHAFSWCAHRRGDNRHTGAYTV
jgi:hypothetical protein